MVLSLGAIIVVMVLAVGFTGMCSFNKGTPENGPVREVDADTFLQIESGAMDYALRIPPHFDGWVPNSARRTAIGGEAAPSVGWVVNDESYVQMVQTGLSEQDAVRGFDESPRELSDTRSVHGVEIHTYTSEERDVRPLYVADLKDERLVVSGAAPQEDFDKIIVETAQQDPVKQG
ncbi:hypothetical protein CGERO_04015 [Corynebacterium gerontici]|uniref:DUF4245 domain-containing protein n=2 Tax=Corynebacterium gerontici TaxID=2079234 RepID=A0A3G6J3Y4_9CORY|nr:hypothetical protein CGERO_04015 [Corynebacterium gerontici]